MTRELGVALVTIALLAAAAAPIAAPHSPEAHFPGLLNAPPTVVHLSGPDEKWHTPFIYRWRLVNQLEQRYEEDRTTSVPLSWLSDGRLVRSSNDEAALGAMLIGVAMGGVAGFAGGALDDILMRSTDFVMVLPTIYVALALRSVLPLVLTPGEVFALLAAIFAVVGAPFVARGVRAIVRTERRLEYAAAAVALGASDARLLIRHLLPASRGFVAVQMTLLVPAFIIAEATLSYVGLGFPDPIASWGTMLHDASNNTRVFADFPWLLSPAAAMFIVVLGINLALQNSERKDLPYERKITP